jgi:dUTP pyrophosphatase
VFLNTDLRNSITIKRGDRIAQGVVCRVEHINWERVSSPDQLEDSVRGAQGFGSSGVE